MTHNEKIVAQLRSAALTGTYNGLLQTMHEHAYIHRCRRTTMLHNGTAIRLLFTRDEGHHALGWWKNPDYERCFHLSVSFCYPDESPASYDFQEAKRWARMFYGHDLRWVWVEPPYSDAGKARDVHHYRLFTDPGWQPLKPRGEVYTKEFTEAGWKSFGELHGELALQRFGPPIDSGGY